MNRRLRAVLSVAVALLIALGTGWIWGASGRSTLATSLRDTQLNLELAEARGDLLQARTDLFEVNFGNAGRRLQSAKVRLQTARTLLEQMDREDEAERLNGAIADVERAQQQAASVDQSANSAVARAVGSLETLRPPP